MVFMHRCGFDAFEEKEPTMLDGWLKASHEIAVCYQPGADHRRTVSVPRRQTPERIRLSG